MLVCERQSVSSFRRALNLGKNVDSDAISAAMENGVLSTHLPYKAPKPQGPRRIPVKSLDAQPTLKTGTGASVCAAPADEAGPSSAPAPARKRGHKKKKPVTPAPTPTYADAVFREEAWVDVPAREKAAPAPAPSPAPAVDPKGKAAAIEKEVHEDGSVEECEY